MSLKRRRTPSNTFEMIMEPQSIVIEQPEKKKLYKSNQDMKNIYNKDLSPLRRIQQYTENLENTYNK